MFNMKKNNKIKKNITYTHIYILKYKMKIYNNK